MIMKDEKKAQTSKAWREEKKAAGMVPFHTWIWPELREKFKQYAKKENKAQEKKNLNREA